MKTAKLIKDNLKGFTGYAGLYKCTPAIVKENSGKPRSNYVICSTADVMDTGIEPCSNHRKNIETCAFIADKNGKVLSWIRLNGSQLGTSSHERVFRNMGYTLIG